MPNQHNQEQVTILQEKLSKAKSAAVIDYQGTKVADMTKLRADIAEVGGEVFVTKNTLIDIAFGKGKVSESLKGMNAVVFSYNDAVSALKKLFDFHKDTEMLEIKQGYMPEDDKVLSPAEVEALSKMPSKTELVAMLLQRLKSPASGMVNVIKAGPRNLVYALSAIAEKKSN
ncbi:MAG TPA: 50S ribosomal protein L10 [Patescibacteria group bacterium]